MYKLQLKKITKVFDKTTAVDNVDLYVKAGEFLSILGPSGCGKTTVLRIIAGFVMPDFGEVVINGRRVNDTPPRLRNLGMVFQSYALFPHMTVFENIAFGLKVERFTKGDIHKKVEEVLSNVELSGFEHRYPGQLSGGQQQRVALARALVKNPEILLLDEPLSNLDAKLRKQMRDEIRNIQKKLGITAVFVTHDQEEALAMSDRVMIMREGKTIQIGTPVEIYEKPVNTFVADFIGQTNIISGEIVACKDGKIMLEVSEKISFEVDNAFLKYQGKKASFSIRPDRILTSENFPPGSTNVFRGKITSDVYMGPISSYLISVFGQLDLTIVRNNDGKSRPMVAGDEFCVQINASDMVYLNE